MSLYNTNPHTYLLSLRKHLGTILYNKNYISSQDINTNVITNIIYHEKTRIVITFKELLIYDDQNECLKRFYFLKESPHKLKNLFEFYETNSKIFPNYCPLPESKYLFKNIKKKQKILDNIEMEENQEHNNNNNSNNNSSQMYNNHNNIKQRDVFTSYIMYSLLSCDNLSSSLLSHTHNSSSVLKLINEIQTNECVDNNNSKCKYKYNVGGNCKRGNSSKHHKKFIKDNNCITAKGEGCVVYKNEGNNCMNANCNNGNKKNDNCNSNNNGRGVIGVNSKNSKKVIDSGNIMLSKNNVNVNYESADKSTPMRKVINQRIKVLETKSKTSNHVVVSSSTSKSKKFNNNNHKNINTNTNIYIQRFNPHLHSKHSPSQKVQISLCNITTSKSKSKSKSKSNSKPKGTLPLSEQNNIKLSTHNTKYSNRIIIKKQTITTSQSKNKEAKSMPKLSYKERLNSLNKLSKNAITIESKRITSPQATISSNIIKFKQKTPDNPQFKQTQINEPSHNQLQQGTKVQTIIKTTLSKNTNNSNSSNALNSNTKSTTSKKSNIKTKYTNYNANIVKEKKIPSLHISFSKHYSSTGNKSKSKSKSPNDNNEYKHIQKQSKVTGSKCFNNNNNMNSNNINSNNQIKNSCLIKQNNLRTLIHKDILTNSEDGRLTERLSNHKSINLIKTTFATISSKSKQHNKISNNTKHQLNTHKKITSSDECNFNQHQPKTARVPSYKKNNNNNKQTQIQQRTINNNNNTNSQQRVFSASNKKNEKVVTQVNSTTTSTTITKRVQTSRGNSSNNNTKNTLYVNSNNNTNTNSTMKKKQIVKKINNFNEIVNSISSNINPISRSTNIFISPRNINTNKSINLKRK